MVKKGDRVRWMTKSKGLEIGIYQGKTGDRAIVRRGDRIYKPPLNIVKISTSKDPVPKATRKVKKAKKVKIDFDDLYGGGASSSGKYINDMADESSFAKARAKVRKYLKVYNKTDDSPSVAGAFAYIKKEEKPKAKTPEGKILELSMDREYTDFDLLDYLDENWKSVKEDGSYETWRKKFRSKDDMNKEWKKLNRNYEVGLEYELSVETK
jgi:hypothetical protein